MRTKGLGKYDQEEDRLKAYGTLVSVIMRSNAIDNIVDFSFRENQGNIFYV
jgi:hypothetical protein